MWTVSEVKQTGKSAFKANYWPCVLVALLMGVFTGAGSAASGSGSASSTDLTTAFDSMDRNALIAVAVVVVGVLFASLAVSAVVKIFLVNPLRLGGTVFFKSNIEQGPASLNLIGSGFRNYWHTFVTLFLRDLFLFLWFLLLIIPGFVKAYSYCMVPYILAEHPDMPPKEIITRSREMMDGNKLQAFLLDLSFIGWVLLGILTLGLLFIFWTSPYMESTHAALYLKLKEESEAA